MAHIWVHQKSSSVDNSSSTTRTWFPIRLNPDEGLVFTKTGIISSHHRQNYKDEELGSIMHSRNGDQDYWVLLSSSKDLYVNCDPLTLFKICVLKDRDEIRHTGYWRVYINFEEFAVIEPFPGSQNELFCPRCKQNISAKDPAVRCPNCKTWYHQSIAEELECWTYSEKCSLCDQKTDLNGTFRWTPEGV